jgi:LmbE family N-acetylglucosaminyl deacetylase
MAELVDDVPARVLAVYAHPDDPDVSCGGTLARWAAGGAEVHVVVCALGDKGAVDPATDPDELATLREAETRAAGKILGVSELHFLGRRDGELENDLPLRAELVALIRSTRPEAILCPDPLAVFFGEHYYNHRDHRVVGWATLDAASPAAGSPLYFPEAGPAHQPAVAYLSATLEPMVYVDITETLENKVEALLSHRSQLSEAGEWFREAVRERAEEVGRAVGTRFAEAFRRVRLAH